MITSKHTKSKIINHHLSGHNFHGQWGLTLRGPVDGFILSKKQAARYSNALCGVSDCMCGGGYGDGPNYSGATIEWQGADDMVLIPAPKNT